MRQFQLLSIFLSMVAGFCFAQDDENKVEWARSLDGYNTTDFTDMDVDAKGNAFVSFTYQGTFSDPELKKVLPDPGYVGGAVMKIDPSGKPLWVIGIKGAWSAWPRSIYVAKNGDFLISGSCEGTTRFESASKAETKVGRDKDQNAYHHPQFSFLARYSPDGNLKWIKTLELKSGFGVGISMVENSKGMLYWNISYTGKLYDKDVMIDENPRNNSSVYKYVILKVSGDGELLGKHPFERFNQDENPLYNSRLVVDHEDALIVRGTFQGSIRFTEDDSLTNDNYYESFDAYIAKFDSSETFQWSRKIGGQHYQEINDLRVDKTGNIYVVGHYGFECILSNGITLLQRTQFEYKSGMSFFYCRYNKDGALDFATFERQPGYNGSVMGRTIALDEKGYSHIFGGFTDTLSFGGTQQAITGQNYENSVFYSRWKGDSLEVLSKPIQEIKGWTGVMDAIIRNGKCYVAGLYYGGHKMPDVKGKAYTFSERDYGRSSFVYSFKISDELPTMEEETDSVDHLLAINPVLKCLPLKFLDVPNVWIPLEKPYAGQEPASSSTLTTIGCGVVRDSISAVLVPNPTPDITKLVLKGMKGAAMVQVYSASGQFLYAQEILVTEDDQAFEFDFSGVVSGMYYIQLNQGEYRKVLRLIKSDAK